MIFNLVKNIKLTSKVAKQLSIQNTIDFSFRITPVVSQNLILPFGISSPKTIHDKNFSSLKIYKRYTVTPITNKDYKFSKTIDHYQSINNPIDFSFKGDQTSVDIVLFTAGFDSSSYGYSRIINHITPVVGAGFSSTVVGKPSLQNNLKKVSLSGFNSNAFGTAKIINKNVKISPPSFMSATYGLTRIYNLNQYIKLSGFNSTVFGPAAKITNQLQRIKPAGFNAVIFGRSVISLGRRYVSPTGVKLVSYGTPWVSHKIRYLQPISIFKDFSSNHVVGGTRFIQPVGFDAVRFGTRIIPEIQTISPKGWIGFFGETVVENGLKIVKPIGFSTFTQPEFRWGIARLYNLRQYVSPYHNETSELQPPEWSKWQKIENKNKHVATYGFDASRFGTAFIYNNARLVAPSVIAPKTIGQNSITYRKRFIIPDAIAPLYISGWSTVHNSARLIRPLGFNLIALGNIERVLNTRRYFRGIGNIESSVFGQPMISDRIREVTFETRYSIHPPIIPLPDIFNYRSDMTVIGSSLMQMGIPDLAIRWNKITPRWIALDFLGIPSIKNVTPELRFRGQDSAELGLNTIFLSRQDVYPDGLSASIFSRPIIADKKRKLEGIGGIRSGIVSDKLIIVKTNAPPFTDQYIEVESLKGRLNFGRPEIVQNVLQVSGFNSMAMGSVTVRSNVIRIDAGIKEDAYGTPFVSLKNRKLKVDGIDNSIECGRPRMSPHTIYATKSVTSQAIWNHDGSIFKYVNSDSETRPAGEVFGRAKISQKEWLNPQPRGIYQFSMGIPAVGLKRRIIDVPAIRAYRMGVLKVSDGTETLQHFAGSDTMQFGLSAVSKPLIYKDTLKLSGWPAQVFGQTWISLKNRKVTPLGFSSLAMGNSRSQTNIYQPQSLYIGPHLPTIPDGFSALRTGIPWVSFKVREVKTESFESFISEYDITAFAKRMRVTRKDLPKPAIQLLVRGISSATALGIPNAKPGVYFIRPDGNSDQFRKGVIIDVK